MTENEKRGQSVLVRILSVIVVISVASNIILLNKKIELFPKKKDLMEANVKLDKQVDRYKAELGRYKGISSRIDAIVEDGNRKIEEKEKEIAGLKRERRSQASENQMLMAQLDSIQEMYLGAIDSLLVEREKSKIINNRIQSLEDVISDLNVKLGRAALLTGDNMQVNAIKESRSGKKQPTALLKKTDEIEVCLDILENRLGKSGLRNIYFVITAPDAEVLFESGERAPVFNHPDYNKTAECTKAESFTYEKKKLHICTTIKPQKLPVTGLYVVEAFTEDSKLGTTTFALR